MAKTLAWITAILLMAFIFYFSQQPVTISNSLSTHITERIIETIEIVVPIDNVPIDTINHIVRKNAHFFLYFFLGIFMLIALKKSGMKGYSNVIVALFLCMIYAVSDEVHQLFVPGRGARLRDVLIDSFGAAVGIIIASIIYSKFKNGTNRSKQMPSKDTL